MFYIISSSLNSLGNFSCKSKLNLPNFPKVEICMCWRLNDNFWRVPKIPEDFQRLWNVVGQGAKSCMSERAILLMVMEHVFPNSELIMHQKLSCLSVVSIFDLQVCDTCLLHMSSQVYHKWYVHESWIPPSLITIGLDALWLTLQEVELLWQQCMF